MPGEPKEDIASRAKRCVTALREMASEDRVMAAHFTDFRPPTGESAECYFTFRAGLLDNAATVLEQLWGSEGVEPLIEIRTAVSGRVWVVAPTGLQWSLGHGSTLESARLQAWATVRQVMALEP